jgi:SAM-dependent methyltransferase
MSNTRFEFYGPQYARFGSALAAEIRREVYGADIGQLGWRSMDEQNLIIDVLQKHACADVLDVGCGSGGPSLAIAQETGCRLTGVDIEQDAVSNALALAKGMGKSGSTQFIVADCSQRLPFEDAGFHAVVCIDAIAHFASRAAAIGDWHRLLRPRGVLLFADAAIVTGPISREDIDTRASHGSFAYTSASYNDALLATAGFQVLDTIDTSLAEADIASMLFEARAKRSAGLIEEEGVDWFHKRQKFLEVTDKLARGRSLSRLFYVTQKSQ